MEKGNDPKFDRDFEKEVYGYNGRKYPLYELRCSANNYKSSDPKEYREIIKNKYSKVYNCIESEVPLSILREVYGYDINFKEIWEPVSGYKNKDYYASNLGRIKHFGKIMLQDDKDLNGILRLVDYGEDVENEYNFNKSTPVYRFVGMAFFDGAVIQNENENKHIHHIDNNGYDCRPENIIPLSQLEHSIAHGWKIGIEEK